MKLGGSSRKNGMVLMGEHYVVSMDYHAKSHTFSYALYEKTQKGHPSLALGLAGAATETVGTTLCQAPPKTARRALGKALMAADLAFSGYLFYSVYGFDQKVLGFHGAEHKVVNAAKVKDAPITVEEAQMASRITRRCGSNLLVHIAASTTLFSLLPFGNRLVNASLGALVGYKLFEMPEEKCPALKSTLNAIGDDLQRLLLTREPEPVVLAAATRAVNILIAAEQGTLDPQKKQMYLHNGESRKWLIRFVV